MAEIRSRAYKLDRIGDRHPIGIISKKFFDIYCLFCTAQLYWLLVMTCLCLNQAKKLWRVNLLLLSWQPDEHRLYLSSFWTACLLEFIVGFYLLPYKRGNNSVVECQLPKLKVAGSNPVSRSNKHQSPRGGQFRPLSFPLYQKWSQGPLSFDAGNGHGWKYRHGSC